MSLPPLYDRWLREALSAPLPAEERATCLRCPLSTESAIGRPAAVAPFHPRSKCCTYLPVLPCFLVGRVLRDPDPAMAEGAATVRARMAAGIAVTPLGLGWPADYDRAYGEDRARDFGRRIALRCPHYLDREGGLCGVWRHRNGVCSTWFCRHERGRAGVALWETVEALLEVVEEGLVRVCFERLGVEAESAERLLNSDEPEDALNGDVPITDALRRRAWGRWYGAEEAFYVQCAEVVEGLTWEDVARACGGRCRARVADVEEALADLAPRRLPPWVRGGRLVVHARDAAGAWVSAHRPYDIEPIPEAWMDLVHGLEPTPVEELLAGLEALAPGRAEALVRAWLEQGVLEPSLA